MENKIEIEESDDLWDGLTEEQRRDLLLLEMYESALSELAETLGDMPEDKDIFDRLFKGNRRYKEVRALEQRLAELVLEQRLHLLGIIQNNA